MSRIGPNLVAAKELHKSLYINDLHKLDPVDDQTRQRGSAVRIRPWRLAGSLRRPLSPAPSGRPTSSSTTPRPRSRIVAPDRDSLSRIGNRISDRHTRAGLAPGLLDHTKPVTNSWLECGASQAIGFACRPHSALLSSSCFVIVGSRVPSPHATVVSLFHGKTGIARQAAGLCLPILGDLRRTWLRVGLRSVGCRVKKQFGRAMVAFDGARA